jgi:hypothetical protein
MSGRIENLTHLNKIFGDFDVSAVDIDLRKSYLIERILEEGSPPEVNWMFDRFPRETIKEVLLASKTITDFSGNYWKDSFGIKTLPKVRESWEASAVQGPNRIDNLKRFQTILWSVDASEVDIDGNANYIIVQVVEWGGPEAIAWMHERYSMEKIKAVLSNCSRLTWRPSNFWNDHLKERVKELGLL